MGLPPLDNQQKFMVLPFQKKNRKSGYLKETKQNYNQTNLRVHSLQLNLLVDSSDSLATTFKQNYNPNIYSSDKIVHNLYSIISV